MSHRNGNGQPETSIHHRVPTSRGGSEDPINKGRLKHTKHEAHHTLYDNLLVHEIIAQILNENKSILDEEWVERLVSLLSENPEFMYKQEAFVGRSIERIQDFQCKSLQKLLEDQYPKIFQP